MFPDGRRISVYEQFDDDYVAGIRISDVADMATCWNEDCECGSYWSHYKATDEIRAAALEDIGYNQERGKPMVIINTTDDLLRLLDENEEFRSAVRNKILTEELIKLRRQFDEFKKDTKKNFDRIDSRFDRVDRRLDGIGGNVGALKGHFASQKAREDAEFIAAEMGLDWNHSLEKVEVLRIWQAAERIGMTDEISRENRRSFLNADIIMDVLDQNGNQAYIAVEISYTAHSDDTEHVTRNAGYLTRFTSVPTYMAVASVFKDSEIDDVITEEAPQAFDVTQDTSVFWLQLEDIKSPE